MRCWLGAAFSVMDRCRCLLPVLLQVLVLLFDLILLLCTVTLLLL